MIEMLMAVCGALVGQLIAAVVRGRRRRAAALASHRRAPRVMLDELWAFKTGLDLAIQYKSTAPIGDPTAVEETWRTQRTALAALPSLDEDVIELAVTHAVVAGGAKASSEALEDVVPAALAQITAATDVLRDQLE